MESAEQRVARQTGLCAEMADLSAVLARHAASQVLAEKPEPPQPQPELAPEQQQGLQPEPQPAPEPNPEPAAPRRRAPSLDLRIPACRPIHPGLLFVRYVATMRLCLALEAYLAASIPAPTVRAATSTPHPEPISEEADEEVAAFFASAERARLRETDATIEAARVAAAARAYAEPIRLCTLHDDRAPHDNPARVPNKYLGFRPDDLGTDIEITDEVEPRAHSPP